MFTHHGKSRTLSHNLKIASLLSFVAGVVNVAGFLAVQKLTTNVTGHFAFFVDEVFKLHFGASMAYFLYIFFFFLGSFTSSFLIEIISRKNMRYVFVIPTIIECIILFLVALFGKTLITENPNLIACSLLFAMGLQNSLVTRISGALIRTTHLTGLFTDLGIELSQLFFRKTEEQRRKLITNTQLRLRIICFFFIGGVIGGLTYPSLGLHNLFIPTIILILGLFYDTLKFKIIHWKRNH
ncbi:YoaK family protein [Pedobacter sp. GR22-10]|uniref:YoaK family protein n=1 Tax=Pedobacter sp. GR22-10 TaxID=2994472 RepID=UPI00224734DE|nr:YoaK family protein [Pedobacter sp. GR22-10]MCX2431085.1 YoaK family protein [Pedobacter sp. GR22-10]